MLETKSRVGIGKERDNDDQFIMSSGVKWWPKIFRNFDNEILKDTIKILYSNELFFFKLLYYLWHIWIKNISYQNKNSVCQIFKFTIRRS